MSRNRRKQPSSKGFDLALDIVRKRQHEQQTPTPEGEAAETDESHQSGATAPGEIHRTVVQETEAAPRRDSRIGADHGGGPADHRPVAPSGDRSDPR